jgi:dTMP kinase
MIVVLEGIDASGKATQSKKLVERLQTNKVESERFDFPRYDSLTGKAILSLLKREWWCVSPQEMPASGDSTLDADIDMEILEKNDEYIAFVLQSLMTVNRYEHIDTLKKYQSGMKPWGFEGVLVLDRYYGSGIAYGEADGLDPKFLRTIHKALPPADLWLFVDITPEESVKRRPERRDEYETRAGFMHKVRDRYLDMFENPSMPGSWHVIDGTGSEQAVHDRIWDIFCVQGGPDGK